MPSAEKKTLLVPLSNPRRRSPWAGPFLAILRPPLLAMGFVFGNLYKLCFGWLDRRTARQNEQRFAEDIRSHLSFLFSEHAAAVIANEGVRFPPSFDGAYVTVAVGTLRLRFVRGRGDFGVSVASEFAPQRWEDFRLVADGISQWDMTRPASSSDSLENFESILRPRLARLQDALSKKHFDATLDNAVKVHNQSVDQYAAKLRETGIVPKIY